MHDHSERGDILRSFFNVEKQPLNERQQLLRRQAAAFAIITFDQTFAEPEKMKALRVHLTPEQVRQAHAFKAIIPDPEQALVGPDEEFSFQGGMALKTYEMFKYTIITDIADQVAGSEAACDPSYAGRRYFEEDFTGAVFMQKFLSRIEEQAVQQTMETNPIIAETEARYVVLDNLEEDPNSIKKPIDPSEIDDIKIRRAAEEILDEFIAAVMESRKLTRKRLLYMETGLVPNAQGELIPDITLRLIGARMAFNQYSGAVNYFLKHWGEEFGERSS